MTFEPNSELLHYRLVEKIGEGGMGVVWKAFDTTLDREVAIKILPEQFALDTDRLTRFEREAKLLASLNHPNIAGIYGLHAVEGIRFLAMEMVQGENLQQRLIRGPLALEDALDVGAQVARALEAAHAQGIVHRDLKPANIVRSEDGTIQVLDFGLAKALTADPASGEADPSLSPTMTSAGTRAGMILGTAAYMSPEQARGKPTDVRADLWAFGAVLMEMITGKQVFAGETVSDILASVLKSDPGWDALPESTPRPIRRLLRRCLRKEADTRLHHPADARIEIEAAQSRPDPIELAGTEAALVEPQPAWKRFLPWALAAVAIIAVTGLAIREFTRPQPASPLSYRFDLELEDASGRLQISPDGTRFAYLRFEDGDSKIWVQSFAEPEGRPLPGTEDVTSELFWSPDGESLAFFTDDTVEAIRIEGGTRSTLCNTPRGWRYGTWSKNGWFLFEVTVNPESDGWYICRPGSLTAAKVERPIPLESGQIKAWPVFLPDGEHYVYIQHVGGVKQAVLGKLDSNTTDLLFPTDTHVQVARNGWYLFARKGQLLAQRFQPTTYLPEGEPLKIADRVDIFEPNGRAIFSVSDQGTVMYSTGEHIDQLVWFDRDGNNLGTAVDPGEYNDSRLSPDGRLLALVILDPKTGTGDLWVHDMERGSTDRVTDTSYSEFSPTWSPDSTEIVYSADPKGPPNLFIIGLGGGQPRELVPFNSQVQYPTNWSGASGTILFQRLSAATGGDIWEVDAAGGEPRALIENELHQYSGRVSPDGRWLAYGSRRTMDAEIYIQPYGRPGSRQRVSVDTGWAPEWNGNNRLVFRSKGDQLLSVTLSPNGDRLSISKPQTFVDFGETNIGDYSLHPDGRVLVTDHSDDSESDKFKVIVGWE